MFAALVALLAEGVDRNFDLLAQMERLIGVALLAEGVDRNSLLPRSQEEYGWSPSSRRAWIEIRRSVLPAIPLPVALLAEGVDRNKNLLHPKKED